MIELSWTQVLEFQKNSAKEGDLYNIYCHKSSRGYFLLPTTYLQYVPGKSMSRVPKKPVNLELVK